MGISPINAPRRGMSMAEVLVALFIMALGVIAILTLFPVGMLQIGQALKDDRTAQCAAQADSFMRAYWKQFVVQNPVGDPSMNFSSPACAFLNPDGGPGVNPHLLPLATTFPQGSPSYPVFFDPMGFNGSWGTNNLPSFQFWAGNVNVPRRTLANIASPLRTCSLMDGMNYDQGSGQGIVVDRELRYNWLWVLQRPQGTLPTDTIATMTIVVFDKRPYLYEAPGAEAAIPNPLANGNGVPGTTSISFPSGTQLGVQKGGWIADLTVIPVANPVTNPGGPVLNANFYRVVSVTDNGVTVDVELQQPIQDTAASPIPTARNWVVVANVSEVFVRPNLENQ
ncbi:MAG TPA: hypothetical protein VGI99_10140 [Gemmataceae bacterium]